MYIAYVWQYNNRDVTPHSLTEIAVKVVVCTSSIKLTCILQVGVYMIKLMCIHCSSIAFASNTAMSVLSIRIAVFARQQLLDSFY
jgi:hypothetical protein